MTPEDCCKSGTEFGEQSALFAWANSKETRQRFPHFFNAETKRCKMYSTNQNFMDAVKGARAKQIGIQSGVADIFIPLPRHGVAGLYIELKIDPTHPQNQRTGAKGTAIAPKAGKVSDEQAAFGRQVIADGYGWAVAEGWKAAAAIVSQYLAD
jgi:hypothetical protein